MVELEPALERRRGAQQENIHFRRATDRLSAITEILGSDAAVAEVLGVSRAQPRRWREGQVPDPDNRDRIIGLDAVISLLNGFLAESSIPKWLTGVNAHLGDRRPISLLREGRLSDVIAAIEAQKTGAFA
ncbi:MAG TPA: hypothetical protein VF665_23180 [Longimicrobium sp.]|jgi:uncharacterized protein (DUF2384 family)|uniref:hypothetical protein n=1 Tax=Longimicrobium sp. TaxID=2029185 RepID=UPI002EDA9924